MEPQGTPRNPMELQVFEELHYKPALQNCPSPSPLLQSALEREAKAIRAQKANMNFFINFLKFFLKSFKEVNESFEHLSKES